MSAASSPKVIMLMVHPRSTSTMFEQVFLNRKEFDVLHEPMGDAWYFGQQASAPRFLQDKERSQPFKDLTYLAQWDSISNPSNLDETHTKRFVKDMAQYYMPAPQPAASTPALPEAGNPTFIPRDQLFRDDIIYTFLIRSPAKAVPSYYRLCTGDQSEVTGFTYFDKNEVGLHELKKFYDLVVEHRKQRGINEPPIIIDSDDLIAQPGEYMRFYCSKVGVPFTEDMLEWRSGNQKHFDKWKGWHTDAENSTGIKKNHQGVSQTRTDWPPEVHEAIKENTAVYEWLHERRVTLPAQEKV